MRRSWNEHADRLAGLWGVFPWANVVMPHATFQNRKYFLDALRGFPPDRTHLAYWEFVDGPIHPFGRLKLIGKKIQVRIARLIGLVEVSGTFRLLAFAGDLLLHSAAEGLERGADPRYSRSTR